MITVAQGRLLTQALRGSEGSWRPAPGDRFVIPDRDLDQVFVVAEMTIEVVDLPTGEIIRFNGTTEWALDSIEVSEAIWLPWEHQLRTLLGDSFVGLNALLGEAGGVVVSLRDGSRHIDVDVERAYARALLSILPLP